MLTEFRKIQKAFEKELLKAHEVRFITLQFVFSISSLIEANTSMLNYFLFQIKALV